MPMTNYALHQSSFQETYTERVLNVSRPQVNDTSLDPDVYLNETNYLTLDQKASSIKDNSFLLLQNWAKANAYDGSKIEIKSNDEEETMGGSGSRSN